jgi:hypothetical protein
VIKSAVTLEIGRPQAQVAELYADPKKGDMVFVATELVRDLPREVCLRLEASKVTVLVTGRGA